MAKTSRPRYWGRNNTENHDEPKSAALTAAAISLGKDTYLNKREIDIMLNGDGNQAVELAWYYYEKIPELRYIARYIANALSVARLYVGELDGTTDHPVPLSGRHPAIKAMQEFGGGPLGQSEMLDRLGVHLTITGDSAISGVLNGSLTPPYDQWRVNSISEIFSRDGVKYRRTIEGREERIPEGVETFRVWRSHPKYWWAADSPTRSSFTVLREIDLLDQHVHASAVSRLAGAGLLLIPDEITFPSEEVETEGEEVDPFVAFLTEVMSIAIKNRDSAAAMVPIMLRGQADAIKEVRHITFSTPFSDAVPNLRQVALRRLALGMDILPEILLGFADSNSWSAWQTDESTLRLHITPLLVLICGALTQGWLRPWINSLPEGSLPKTSNPDNLVVWFDLSNLRVKPDVTKDAENAYGNFELGGDGYRHILGISDSAKPTNDEYIVQLMQKLIMSGNPQLVGYAIDVLSDKKKLGLPSAIEATIRISETVGRTDVPPDYPGGQSQPAAVAPGSTPADSASGNLPGKRSSDKQTAIPTPDPTNPDPNNNQSGKPSS